MRLPSYHHHRLHRRRESLILPQTFPPQHRLAVSIGNAMLLAIRILGAAAQLAAKVKAVHNILMLLQPDLP